MRLIEKDIREHWKAAAFFLAAVVILVKLCGAACISQLIVGLPCPACGMTRAALLFLSGHWEESFRIQPFFFALMIGLVLFIVCRYCIGNYQKLVQYYGIFMLIAAIVFYLYRMVRYFPDVPPMTYREDNLLAYLLQMGRKLIFRS